MKKKFLLMSAIVLTLKLSVSFAEEVRCDEHICFVKTNSCGSNCQWSINNGVLTITGSGEMDDFGYDFENGFGLYGDDRETNYLPPWYDQADSITSVVVDGLSSVGKGAFDYYYVDDGGYKSLKNASLSETVKIVGINAFALTSIESIDMPGVTAIEDSAFEGAYLLTSVNAPNVTTIGDYAFFGAKNLSYINLSEGASIGDGAFAYTSISGCSGSDLSACHNCGDKFVKIGIGCVSSCGDWYAPENGICAPDYETDKNGNILLDDDSPEITEDIFGLSTVLPENTKIICRGDIEKCKDLLKNYPKYYDITDGYGNKTGGYYAPTDMSNLATSATEANCESGRYYWSGSSCNNKSGGINCDENFKQMETWCNRIRYTPADAAKVLKDTDNEIIMTFKVNR